MADADEWLTGEQAGVLAGVDPSTIWRAANAGLIKYSTSGGSERRSGPRRYWRADVVEFARRRESDVSVPELARTVEEQGRQIQDLRRRVEELESGE